MQDEKNTDKAGRQSIRQITEEAPAEGTEGNSRKKTSKRESRKPAVKGTAPRSSRKRTVRPAAEAQPTSAPTGEAPAVPFDFTRAHEFGYLSMDEFKENARNQMVEAALRIAAAGYKVIPVWPSGKDAKKPIIKQWTKKATCDPQAIRRLWNQYPDAAIGVVTGELFFVLDVDNKNGKTGSKSLAALEAKHGKLPRTRAVRTPSGGEHYYFRIPPGVEIPNRVGRPGPGLDIRGQGGQVLVPPSMLFNDDSAVAGRYETIVDCEIADAPAWLINLISAAKPGKSYFTHTNSKAARWAANVLEERCAEVAATEEGERNAALNKAAFAIGQIMGRGRLDRGSVEAALMGAARDCGYLAQDGERAARSTIKSGLGDGLKNPLERPIFPEVTKAGIATDSHHNMLTLLDWLGVTLRWNSFTHVGEVEGLDGHPRLDDEVLGDLWGEARKLGFRVRKDILKNYCVAFAREQRYHPVRELFDELQMSWNGKPALDTWLADYLGATDSLGNKDSAYLRAVGSKLLIGLVRRVRKPGTKFDSMVVLEGPQGVGKSTAAEILAINPEWFTDAASLTLNVKEMMEQTAGKLIIEMAEMKGKRLATLEQIKTMLSRKVDRARRAYAEFAVDQPREFILIGTTNDSQYLKDPTGNPRFLPVKTGTIDLERLRQDILQLYAEAAYREAQGESIMLPRELWDAAAREQQVRMEHDPWLDELENALENLEGKLRVADVRRILSKTPERWTHAQDVRLGVVMRSLGWEHKQLRDGGAVKWHYAKGPQPYPAIRVYEDPDGSTRAAYKTPPTVVRLDIAAKQQEIPF